MEGEEPIIRIKSDKILGTISKVAFADGYGYSQGAFRKRLTRLGIKVSSAKSYTPKEINEIIEVMGEPDWARIRAYGKADSKK